MGVKETLRRFTEVSLRRLYGSHGSNLREWQKTACSVRKSGYGGLFTEVYGSYGSWSEKRQKTVGLLRRFTEVCVYPLRGEAFRAFPLRELGA